MSGNDNVISLKDGKRDGVARQVLAKRLLGRCKDISFQQLRRILQAMFDTADDALFKMAEHAEGGGDTNLYFDSMRIVRLQRTSIEKSFFDQLAVKFTGFLEEGPRKIEPPDENPIDYDALELVSEDDLEITLATQRLVQKIQSLYAQDLSAINKRLAYLLDREEIDAEAIPFGAEAIVEAYAQATENTNLLLEVRIILLKLFDLSCIHGLAALFAQINKEFVEADVLPVIKTHIRKSEDSTSRPPTAAGPAPVMAEPDMFPTAGGETTGDNLWNTLQGYLSQQRGSAGHYPTIPGQGGSYAGATGTGAAPGGPAMYGGTGGGPVVAFTTQELLGSLTNLQQDIEGALPEGGAHAVGNYLRVQLQNNSQTDDKAARQLTPIDNDLIDVVCLIFDYILADPQLADAAKASIRRLQIPMLKVALLDKQFFSTHGHPARDLLNLLAQAALGIDIEDEEDPTLAKIDEIVQRIIDEFSDDIILFDELKQEFNAFLKALQEQEAALITDIERRQQEREELALARAWVRETLEQHLLGRTLPGVVVDIILGPWKDVMLHTYLQEGEDSTLWKTQIRFIDVLAWSVEPKQLMLDRNKLGNIIRQLINTLREGLDLIDYPQAEVEAIFTALEPYHLASVRGEHYQHNARQQDELGNAIDTIQAQYAAMQAEETPGIDEHADSPEEDKVILEDIVLEGWEPDPMLDAINDEYLDLARHLEMGRWVEFQDQDGNRRHAKLAWKSELLGEYTFLNWKFDVVADKNLVELADDLRHGKARIVENVPLMDRALSSVLSTLIPKSK